jgi:hypothetical protein
MWAIIFGLSDLNFMFVLVVTTVGYYGLQK